MAEPKTAECTTCGWESDILDDEVLADWNNHGDEREDPADCVPCPSPNVQWKVI